MRRAVVTGASRGIGLELVHQLLGRGVDVVAGCRRPDEARELGALVRAAGCGAVVPLDVADPASIASAGEAIAGGGGAVDLLVNNAGIWAPAGLEPPAAQGPLPALRADALLEVLRVNCIGPALVAQALAPLLARSKEGGRLVNVTSDRGSVTVSMSAGSYAYAMSKAALNMLTRKLAEELREQGITVVAMHPGSVRTDLGGAGADLSPAESVAGMLEVVDRLRPPDTGRAFTYSGAELPW